MKKLSLLFLLICAGLASNAQKLVKLESTTDTVAISEDRIIKTFPLTASTARVEYVSLRGDRAKWDLSVSADSIVARSTKMFYISDSSVALNAANVLSVVRFDQGSSVVNYSNKGLLEKITNPSVSVDSLINFINAR